MTQSNPNPNQLARHLLDVAASAARAVGPMLVEGFTHGVTASEKTAFYDLVTEYDRNAEKTITQYIFEHHPDSAIVGEEGGAVGNGAVRWYVDPIDGTTNFATGFPFFCVSIGAEFQGQLLAGVVFDPLRNELFSAAAGGGAMLNGQPIRFEAIATEQAAVLLTDFPVPGLDADPAKYELFGQLSQRFQAVRRVGSTALQMAYVCCGRADATLALHISPWDVAAGYLLIAEAGGVIQSLGRDQERPWLNRGFMAYPANFELDRSVFKEFLRYNV
ncbi:MAG: Inositol-1-monophosphatase [Anaerolineae bacterium]|nr:Inositol-1-monophosphatase [Anaerolineae bacterium]